MGNLLTPEEVAKMLSVKARTIRIWLRTSKLKGVKINRLWRIKEEDFKQLVHKENLI